MLYCKNKHFKLKCAAKKENLLRLLLFCIDMESLRSGLKKVNIQNELGPRSTFTKEEHDNVIILVIWRILLYITIITIMVETL